MKPPPLQDETAITELSIGPDGRVFAHGASRQVLELLAALQPNDRRVRGLLQHVRQIETQPKVVERSVAR